MKAKKIETYFEFLVFGIAFGIIEDLIAVKLITGETITWRMVGIIVLVAIPFAFFGEIIIDNANLVKFIKKIKDK